MQYPDSFEIAGRRLSPPLVLSPMAGVTDSPFRRVAKRCGGIGLIVTEFISVEGLTRGNLRSHEMMKFTPEQRPLAIQIFGYDEVRMRWAAEIAQERMRREESKAIEPTIQTPSSGSGRKVSTAGRLEAVPGPVPPPATAPVVVPIITQGKGALLGIPQARVDEFAALCARERCVFAVVGTATAEERLVVGYAGEAPAIDLPMDVLFGKAPKMHRDALHPPPPRWAPLDTAALDLREAGLRVLAHPTVASKSFLVTIGDRSVGGLTARDQMVGPWQLPVADCAITFSGFEGFAGEAMAIGERTPLALLDSAAAARMAVGEAITNLCAAPVDAFERIKLSANWMAAAGHAGEDALLFDAVKAVGMELCPQLGLSIPVGKDSLSMQAAWSAGIGDSGLGIGETQSASANPESRITNHKSVSPVSLIVSAFAPVADVRAQLTPLLEREVDSELWLIGLGGGRQRMGGSILAQCFEGFGGDAPDLDDAQRLRAFFELIRDARGAGLLRAYHDRSDGGAFAALCEMAFASHCGLDIELDGWGEDRAEDACRTLFNEELGAVVQVAVEDRAEFADLVARHGLVECAQRIARPTTAPAIRVLAGGNALAEWRWDELFDAWWSVTHAMQRLRDNPESADAERDAVRRFDAPGLQPKLAFDAREDVAAPFIATGARPRVAILREQGVNGQVEMASAFDRAGFAAVDVHMSDLIAGRVALAVGHIATRRGNRLGGARNQIVGVDSSRPLLHGHAHDCLPGPILHAAADYKLVRRFDDRRQRPEGRAEGVRGGAHLAERRAHGAER